MNRVTRWAAPGLMAFALFGVVAPALGQTEKTQPPGQPPDRPPQPTPGMRGGDLNRAKEMAQLIKDGQLPLREAAEIAEKHCKGTALTVKSTIETGSAETMERPKPSPPGGGDVEADAVQQPKPGEPKPGEQPKPGEPKPGEPPKTGGQPKPGDAPKAGEKAEGRRIVYEVLCFAEDKLLAVRVDGMLKKVVGVKENQPLADASGTP